MSKEKESLESRLRRAHGSGGCHIAAFSLFMEDFLQEASQMGKIDLQQDAFRRKIQPLVSWLGHEPRMAELVDLLCKKDGPEGPVNRIGREKMPLLGHILVKPFAALYQTEEEKEEQTKCITD